MFDTIIVGVDGSEGGRDALALAGMLQRKFGGALVAVIAYPHYPLPSRAASRAVETSVSRDATKAVRNDVYRAGVHARAIAVPDGSPARALHHIAESERADLIVVGSDRQGPIGRVLAGNVTSGALYGAPCPVAVAPRGLAARNPVLHTVGVGYDATPEAKQALELARAVAKTTDALLELICVVAPPVPLGPWAVEVTSMNDSERSEHERVEALAAAALRNLDVLATAQVVEGRPDTELADRSSGLDLLVVGSRGYGPLKRLMLGSTSSKLVRSAACPVIVVPRGAHEVVTRDPALTTGERAQPHRG
jgi:nucleotide-binding universal stress UspA family protein